MIITARAIRKGNRQGKRQAGMIVKIMSKLHARLPRDGKSENAAIAR